MKKPESPDYIRIYSDLISKKHPDKTLPCERFLKKKKLTVLEVIKLNELIFENKTEKESSSSNQKFRSYNKSAILEILNFQSKHNMNNSQLAIHFNLSRNTVAKWKKTFSAQKNVAVF